MPNGSSGTQLSHSDLKIPETQAEWRAIPGMSPAQIADEFGDCYQKCQQSDPYEKRMKALGAAMVESCAGVPADQSAVLYGARWTVRLAARINESRILDIRKVYKAMGAEAFWAACSIALKALKDAVGESRYTNLVVTERTGYRKLTAVPKAAEAQEKAA